MKISRFIASLSLFCGLLWAGMQLSAHPYHVSVFQIDYNPESKSLEITIKVFVDDMQKALEAWSDYGLDFDSPKSNPFFKNYILKTSRIKVGGESKSINFLGKEADIESAWIYLEVPLEGKPDLVEFETSFLTEIYDDQMNLVHLKLSDEEKQSGRLSRERASHEFDFR